MAPMTREEYEHQQSKVRKVYDPDTGRHRYVDKGKPLINVNLIILIM